MIVCLICTLKIYRYYSKIKKNKDIQIEEEELRKRRKGARN